MADKINQTREEHQKALDMKATKEFYGEIAALLRTYAPLVYLTCTDEDRMLDYFKTFCSAKGYKGVTWDCHMGFCDIQNEEKVKGITLNDPTDAAAALDEIIQDAKSDKVKRDNLAAQGISGKIYILLDFYHFIDSPDVERRLRRLALIRSMTTVIIAGPILELTPGLENIISIVDFPYPNKNEIIGTLKSICDSVKKDLPGLYKKSQPHEHEIVGAVSGLSLGEATSAMSKSLVIHKKFDIPQILAEKKQVIRRRGILEFYEPKFTLDDIGGLNNLVRWLKKRKIALDPKAAKYGLPPLKGAMILGIPGVGKSLTAKAVAAEYNFPLLRLDFGSLFQSHVGESEERVREMVKLATAMQPCVLWCDEIDRGMSGSGSSNHSDGGVTDRVIGTFLTWMQEKEGNVFVIATANDFEKIPPAFLRAGRFDEVFFVGLPTYTERKEILKVLLRRNGRDPNKFGIEQLAAVSEKCTGSEIEKAIHCALYEGFADNLREITTEDIKEAFSSFMPQYNMRPEYFEEMAEWATKRGCVMASDPEEANSSKSIKISLSD